MSYITADLYADENNTAGYRNYTMQKRKGNIGLMSLSRGNDLFLNL